MNEIVLTGTPAIHVVLRRHVRARRFTLRVSRLDGRATLTVPPGAPVTQARAFLEEHRDWLHRQLSAGPAVRAPGFGDALPVLGTPRCIVPGQGRQVRLGAGEIAVPGPAGEVSARLAGFLRGLARAELTAAARLHSDVLGRSIARISLRDPRSRWGSCTADGALMFSWRLVLAPAPVLDYVAAHEVAHLAELNHGPRFWKIVAGLCPDHAAHRAWLRREGAGLHRYDFSGAPGGRAHGCPQAGRVI